MNCRICGKNIIQSEIINCVTTDVNSVYKTPCKQDNIEVPFYYCSTCHHGQIDDVMPEDYYRNYSLLTAGGNNKTGGNSILRENHYRNVLKRIKNYLPSQMQQNSIYMDIGCGTGTIMRYATEYFSIVRGVEPSEDECKIAAESGLTVDNFFFDEAYIDSLSHGEGGGVQSKLDAFSAIQVFEHLENPVDTAKLAYIILNENGIGYVEVPNGTNIVSNSNYTDVNSDHLSYFSVESLVKTFMEAGFQIIEASEVCDGAYVAIYVRKPGNSTGFNDRFKNDINLISKILGKYRRVGIYGCGMKGRAFIKAAGCKISNFTPAHFFDANEDIAGYYVPNCLTPVEIPTEHAVSECDAIYITAVEFKQEIMQYLYKLNYKGQIYIMGHDTI